ncbi:MAG TPA: sugar phosphate isomerase/epimerase [Candidatus Limnocylindrales bacterium]|nr:sugar phosphate isomerase/epimerase [Candidatus Limnocylindrales bacterium]
MKIGVFDPVFGGLELEPMLDRIVALGLEAVEIGTGNYPGDRHCRPGELLDDPSALARFRDAFGARGLTISALSCHGNPIHPDRARAARDDAVFRDTVRLASALGVGVVNLFSGCPGDGPDARQPNWVTCAWPPEYGEIVRWQWEAVVVPYWREAGRFAAEHGVRLAFEMHPGFVVYNPRTLLRLRDEVGEVVGANLDPSHLFWQGIDPILAIRELGPAIYHVHAKDTAIDPYNTARNGVLDLAHYSDVANRSWVFRSVGDGHDLLFWKRFVSALRVVGYDHVLSIEHEDSLASTDEGIARAIATLRAAVLSEPATAMWWA